MRPGVGVGVACAGVVGVGLSRRAGRTLTLSESSASTQEPEEEMVAGKTRFGRPVLSARLRADTKFDVNKRMVQVNLHSADASGNPVYARYNMPLLSDAQATEFAELCRKSLPAA